MPALHRVLSISTLGLMLLTAACGGDMKPTPPTAPTPPDPPPLRVTANVFVLPDAVSLGHFAFGDEDIVIYKGELMRWINTDKQIIVADSPNATDFKGTNDLPEGGEQSFVMTKLGTTKIHCTIHPEMTGTLVVREH